MTNGLDSARESELASISAALAVVRRVVASIEPCFRFAIVLGWICQNVDEGVLVGECVLVFMGNGCSTGVLVVPAIAPGRAQIKALCRRFSAGGVRRVAAAINAG